MEDGTIIASASLPIPAAIERDEHVLEIWGGAPLSGRIPISGAKNSALVLQTAAILCSGEGRLQNVPNLADIDRMGQVLSTLGVRVRHEGSTWDFDASHLTRTEAPYELVSKFRASFFAIGPILARMGEARVPLPGGCAIGARPVELHVRGLQAMGAHVQIENGTVHAWVKQGKRLRGAKIYLDYPSVGATETLMMAATLADGETILEGAAREPEIIDLANFCLAMGAKIQGAGTDTITIQGVPALHSAEHAVMPDRIEAGTFLIAGAITRSPITIGPIVPEHLTAVIAKLEAVGVRVVPDGSDGLRVIPADHLRAVDIETLPFPGFPTDMQAQFMTLLTLAEGNSAVSETVFENRLQHAAELARMGANIRVKNSVAIVEGVSCLSGAPVTATDLRASAALVLAGLAARGKTIVTQLHHLDRGYEQIEHKLQMVGARIRRVSFAEAEASREPFPTSPLHRSFAIA